MTGEPYNPADWARMIQANWEKRARSPYRDFYVDSRPDYAEKEVWDRYARATADLVLTGLEPESISSWQVLDLGCGVGRLVPYVAPLVAGYTGVDIAAGMIEEARRRSGGLPRTRFFAGDGLGLPPEARDRRYDLAFSLAVLIHNPRPVIASLVAAVYESLAPGGQFRFQVLADPEDPTGLVTSEEAEESRQDQARVEQAVTPAQMELIDGHYYMGDRFHYDQVEPFMKEAGGGEIELIRMDPGSIYGVVRKPL